MFYSTRIAASAALFAASVGVGVAVAQQPTPQQVNPPKPAASGAATQGVDSAGTMAYRSDFAGYKGLTEQPVASWRASNDTVGRIGGWQSYAREGQGGQMADGAADKAPADTPSSAKAHARQARPPTASASNAMPADHQGHMKP